MNADRLKIHLQAQLKRLVIHAPKEIGDDPKLIFTLEMPATSAQIGALAAFVRQPVALTLESLQGHAATLFED